MEFKHIGTLLLLLLATTACGMDKPSWAQGLWQSAKEKLISFPLIQKELQARKQYQQLRKEVEKILKNGKTVQEAETKRMRDQHQKILQDFKKCACIPDKEWNEFLQTFAQAKEKNPLFDPDFKNHHKTTYQDAEYQKISDSIDKKLRKKNLNPDAVTKIIIKNPDSCFMGYATQYYYTYFPTTNHITINVSKLESLNDNQTDHVMHHEITHIQEHHSVEATILARMAKKEKPHCFKELNHQHENEANFFYTLQNIKAAKKGIEYYCRIDHDLTPRNEYDHINFHPNFTWSSYPELYAETDTHPSPQTQCQNMKRTLTMLEIEKKLKEKSTRSKVAVKNKTNDYKQLHFVFDPAFNS